LLVHGKAGAASRNPIERTRLPTWCRTGPDTGGYEASDRVGCSLIQVTSVFEEHTTSIFRVEESAKPSKKPEASRTLRHAGFLLELLFDPEDRGGMLDLNRTTRPYIPEHIISCNLSFSHTFCV
jgi:hypothetical protein